MKTEETKFLEVFPVTRIPNAFFKSTPHEIFRRTTQTLSGHGYTGEYYKRMFLNESPWCLCSRNNPGAPILMTRLHVLRECSRYQQHRHILTKAIPDFMDQTWLPHLLAEPKHALPALAKFLEKSGALTKLGIPFHIDLILPPPRDP